MVRGSYWERMIEVDMTAGTAKVTNRHMQYVDEFPLGRPLGYRLLWEALMDKPGYDRFGPDAPFIIMSGVMTGHPFPGLSRYECMCKSGATYAVNSPYGDGAATFGHAAGGSSFGAALRWSGHDCIYVTGKSATPKYLYINNMDVKLLDATEYWGMNIADLETAIFKKYGYQHKVTAIGPAGESMNFSAALISEGGHAAARSGVGAVMGSKKLKAVVVYGDLVVPHANSDEDMRERVETVDQSVYARNVSGTRRWGTANMLSTSNYSGTKCYKNHDGGWEPHPERDCPGVETNFWVRHGCCYFCQARCVKMGVVNRGPFKGLIAEGPEYEDALISSNLCMETIQDVGAIMELRDSLGFDTISSGGLLGFAFEAFEKGDITTKMLGGNKTLKWGSAADARQLLQDLCTNFDYEIYDWLRRGPSWAAWKIGNNSIYYSMSSKNHPYPAWHIAAQTGNAVTFAVTSRGACHMEGTPGTGARNNIIRDMSITCVTPNGYYSGANSKESLFSVLNGLSLEPAQWQNIALRAAYMAKIFNLREGFDRADDVIAPKNYENALKYGPPGATWLGFKVDKEVQQQAITTLYVNQGWDHVGIPDDGHIREIGAIDWLLPVVADIRARYPEEVRNPKPVEATTTP